VRAVADAHSWRHACRILGVGRGGSAVQRVRAHAVRLGLDVAHLEVKVDVPAASPTGVVIPPDDLRAAVAGARSWAEVNRRLGLADAGGGSYVRIQRAVAAAGIDVSHIRGHSWGKAPIEAMPTPYARPYDSARLRQIGTAIATAWFLGRGYMVSVPVEPAGYDLIAESDMGLQRVQVKTTNNGTASLTRTQYGLGTSRPSTGKYGSRPYAPDEIDLFFIVTGTGLMYLIPLAAVAGKRGIALERYAQYLLPDTLGRPYSNSAESSG
jgi:PD-(D/E)XK endonuclease